LRPVEKVPVYRGRVRREGARRKTVAERREKPPGSEKTLSNKEQGVEKLGDIQRKATVRKATAGCCTPWEGNLQKGCERNNSPAEV